MSSNTEVISSNVEVSTSEEESPVDDKQGEEGIETYSRDFKYFKVECQPNSDKGALLYLINRNTNKSLKCYVRTLNAILDSVPKGLELLQSLPAKGSDMKFMEDGICENGQNKVVMIVQRYKNHLSLLVQLKFDRTSTSKFEFTRSVVQFSPEDDLKALREFAYMMCEKAVDSQQGVDVAQVEIPSQDEEPEEKKSKN